MNGLVMITGSGLQYCIPFLLTRWHPHHRVDFASLVFVIEQALAKSSNGVAYGGPISAGELRLLG